MPNWYSLPTEIRIMILELITQHQRLCTYATVSKEWQIMIEKKTFHQLKLKQSCLDDFERLGKRQRGLVRHIWLNIELQRYTCRCCRRWESMTWTHQNNKIIIPAIAKLFSILSTWKSAKEGLTLELNAYSPSDPEHWFKNCYFGASGEDEILGSEYPSQDNTAGIHDPEHGWRDGKHLPKRLKRLSVFEDFNENYLALFQVQPSDIPYIDPDEVRITTPEVGAAFAARSLKLEQLSVSFIADAQYFFEACQPQWRWNHLQSLTLTSRLMSPKSFPLQITYMLQNAGKAAFFMPRLEVMTMWNSIKGEACAFTYRKKDGLITWRGTWEFKLEHTVLKVWKRAVQEYGRHEFRVETQLLDCEIRSHGDAIYYLDLPSVIDPLSMRQIRRENSRGHH
ncbi:hypothetical protein EDB80DRAFT_586633 [Ilyonectria destructans]|nr:hypothetical protein EDB80DRAFT_586633 [Ilyonectria destructans]